LRFELKNVDEFQLEVTGYCNAACPQCPRNLNGDQENPHLQKEHLSREIIDRTFTSDVCQHLRQIFFCGNYGDPIMHPKLLDIMGDFMEKNSDINIYMHTNGGARTPKWWAELAKVIGPNGRVGFNIDGLKDTNHIYRCNTDFKKIMANVRAFIKAGGRAEWNFIVFKHNEHQVLEAEQLAKKMGFETFNKRATGRFLDYNNFIEIDSYPKHNKDGEIEYHIEIPTEIKNRNSSMVFLPKLKEKHDHYLGEYFSNTEISCDSLCRHHGNAHGKQEKSKLLITSNGLVLPCNFFNHNLVDARFHNRDIAPGANDMSFLPNGKNQVRDFLDQHNATTEMNINYTSLADVMQNSFWDDLVDSFDKKLGAGRIFECALTCGKDFYKVWDQVHFQQKSYLITGGGSGLGLELIHHFKGVNISRSNADIQGDITNRDDIERIAEESLNYDVFVNNAFDGPAGEPHVTFGQVNLLTAVFDKWKAAGKEGHIINIGSTSATEIVAPDPTFERYRVTKAALIHASKQCTAAFKENQVPFKTTVINFDRLDTPLSRSRDNWTGNGTPLSDIIKQIEMITDMHPNTCIDEVTSWVNRDYE